MGRVDLLLRNFATLMEADGTRLLSRLLCDHDAARTFGKALIRDMMVAKTCHPSCTMSIAHGLIRSFRQPPSRASMAIRPRGVS